MAKNIEIPRELRKVIGVKRAKRILACIALMAVNTFIVLMWGEDILHLLTNNTVLKYSLYVLFISIPIFITKVYKVFTDTYYCGTVKKVDIETAWASATPLRPTRETMYKKVQIYLTIETVSGKSIKRKVHETPLRAKPNFEKYKVGDVVLHLHGTGVTVTLPKGSDTYVACALCGEVNEIENEICKHCGNVLIKCDGLRESRK